MKKQVLIFFLEQENQRDDLSELFNQLDENRSEICTFHGIMATCLAPHDLLGLIEQKYFQELTTTDFTIFSSNYDMLCLLNRLYHRMFNHFVWISGYPLENINYLDGIYQRLLKAPIHPLEEISKKIFVYHADGNQEMDCKEEHKIHMPLHNIKQLFEAPEQNRHIQVAYQMDGAYHLFELTDGADTNIIPLDNLKIESPMNFTNTIIYFSSRNPELFEELYELLNNGAKYTKKVKCLDRIKQHLILESQYGKNSSLVDLKLLSRTFDIRNEIFILSFLLDITGQTNYLNQILQKVLENDEIDSYEKFFLMYQCSRVSFVHAGMGNNKTSILFRQLYRSIYISFKEQLHGQLQFIPKQKRNQEIVIVLTGQFLGMNHGPTKTALDRCYSLIKDMNKKVLLINTKELLPKKGVLPFYNVSIGNVNKELQSVNSLNYKDISIPYYQPECDMPSLNEMLNIIQNVKKANPYFIISLGSANLTADLCSNIAPVATISLVPSGLPLTEGQFSVIGRKVNKYDLDLAKSFGIEPGQLIESLFTSNFKPQQHQYTREDFSLPQDKFLIAVVGGRLNEEVTEEFLNTLLNTAELGSHIVFIGSFEHHHELVLTNPALAKHSSYIGFQDDILAVLELCDLYANPRRTGGGTSAAEAMFKGKPVVTYNYGDVAVGTGPEFWVQSPNELIERVERFIREKEYYQAMSEKARARAEILMDTQSEFRRLLLEIENSLYFH